MFNDLIDTNVIIRANGAGVHFGTLKAVEGDTVQLINARRLWYWHAAKSISLSAVAAFGIKQSKSKIAATVPLQTIFNALEILPVTPEAADTISEAPIAETN